MSPSKKEKMTIRDLIKQYPKMEILPLIEVEGSPFPSWSYSLDDDIVEWYIEKTKNTSIMDALFNNGKIKTEYKDVLVFTWRRKERKGKNV